MLKRLIYDSELMYFMFSAAILSSYLERMGFSSSSSYLGDLLRPSTILFLDFFIFSTSSEGFCLGGGSPVVPYLDTKKELMLLSSEASFALKAFMSFCLRSTLALTP